MTRKRIHLFYSIVLSASAVIAGICLMVACVGIYRSGDHPFSRASIAAAFQTIAVPVYVLLALVIGGIGLDLFYPPEKGKRPIAKQYDTILANLQKKVDITRCEPELCKAILKQQRSRRMHLWISYTLLALCSYIFLRFALNGENYPADANTAVVTAMFLFFPCLLIPFGYGVFTAYWNRRSVKKEIELVKQAISAGASAANVPSPAPIHSEKPANIAKYAILAVSLGILIYGIFAGGTADVLAKAAAICTECVGLG